MGLVKSGMIVCGVGMFMYNGKWMSITDRLKGLYVEYGILLELLTVMDVGRMAESRKLLRGMGSEQRIWGSVGVGCL